MHDTFVIVRNVVRIDLVQVIFLELAEFGGMDVFGVDFHVLVSVWTSLLVLEAQRMTKLMSSDSFLKLSDSCHAE